MSERIDNHRTFGPGYYCENHNATFETHEAVRNSVDCPWCGDDVSDLI